MTDEMMPMPHASDENSPLDPAEDYLAVKTMRKTFSRYGFALFIAILVWVGFLMAVSFIAGIFEALGYPALDFYSTNLLLFNEIGLAIAVLVGALILRPIPKWIPKTTQEFSAGRFFKILAICFAIGFVGNMIGTVILTVWNTITGNEVSNEVLEVISETNPWMTLLLTGIVCPFLEELLCRKLLIDRIRPYGELVCILTSATFFALFHQNFSQFFYAFGIGAIAAYLYYRSGSFGLTFLLHAIFNIVSGVISMVLSADVLNFAAEIEKYTEDEFLEILPTLVGEYAVPLMLYFLYLFVTGLLTILGIIFFCLEIGKFKPMRGEKQLSAKKSCDAIIKNEGTLSVTILLVAMMIMSLFTI